MTKQMIMISNSFSNSTLGRFRLVALAEGTSFLLLLLIAMPLKYLANMPGPVLYIGWIHGVLFLLYTILLLKVWVQYKWTFTQAAGAMIAAVLPFGTFVLERKLKNQYMR